MNNPFDKYELRKDISTPDGYIRAGVIKTDSEWKAQFPNCNCWGNSEWFINLKEVKPSEKTVEKTIVDDVFKSKGLGSISYKEAAMECMNLYRQYWRTQRDGETKID